MTTALKGGNLMVTVISGQDARSGPDKDPEAAANGVIKSTGDKEKRRDERFACRSPVEWTYFNRPERYSGQMCNFSLNGACFECPQALMKGATILVRLEGHPAECRPECRGGSDCPWPRTMILAEVKWCRGISGSAPPRFGVGVKLHLPP